MSLKQTNIISILRNYKMYIKRLTMIHAEFRYLTVATVFNERERSHHTFLGGLR